MKKAFLLLLFLWYFEEGVTASSTNFTVTSFQLPVETKMYDILEDRNGFLWIATDNGLWRWDGGDYKHYQKDPTDSTGLTINHISCLFEDSKDILWVGTYGGGLLKYIEDCDCFKRYLHLDEDKKSLSFNEVKVIMESSDQNLYVGTDGGGLNILDRNSEIFRSYEFITNDSTSISHNNVLSLAEGEKGDVYIGTWRGLNRFNPASNTFKKVGNSQKQHNRAYFHLLNYKNRIFSLGNPPFQVDRNNNLKKIEFPAEWNNSGAIDSKSQLWLSNREGIQVLNNNLEVQLSLPYSLFYSTANRRIGKIAHRKNDTGTWVLGDKGLFFLLRKETDTFQSIFKQYQVDELIETRSNFWVVDGESVSIFQKHDNNFLQSISGFGQRLRLVSNKGKYVWAESKGQLYQFSEDGNLLKQQKIDTSIYSTSIQLVSDSIIWLGHILGATKYNIQNESFRKYECNRNIPDGIGYFHRVNKIFEDSKSQVWIGTDGDGLKLYLPQTNTFRHFRHRIGNTTSVQDNFIMDLIEDRFGNLWIGTKTGLCYLDNFGQFHWVQHRLLNDLLVNSLAFDQRDKLWIASSEGLFEYNPRTKYARRVNGNADLKSKKSNDIQALENGSMMVRYGKTIKTFEPQKILPRSTVPKVYLSNLWINNQPVKAGARQLAKNIILANKIELDHSDVKFEIGFRAIHYVNNNRCRYAYQLEGFDKDWIEVSGEPKATYTNIPAGKYTFRVKASNEDGIWNDEVKEIYVSILPSFWEQIWVRALLVLILVVVVLWLFRLNTKRERNRSKFEIEKARVKQVEEMTQMKLRFFTNISHELRTPLTLIASPLEKYVRENTAPKKSVLNMMHKNTTRLLELINQILDFRKLENEQQQLKVSKHRTFSLFENIQSAYSYWSDEKQITFKVSLPDENYILYYDKDVVEKIVTNLISNAFKFTPTGGNIDLKVSLHESVIHDHQVLDGQMKIEIIDNGEGMPKDVQEKVFERFYQLDDSKMSAHGSGIGLSLTAELTELHHGQIKLQSELGQGTHFTISIPIGQNYYGQNQIQGNVEYPQIDPKSTVILVIEDHEDIRSYMVEELSESYEVIEAEDGKIGLQKALSVIPNVIISDVMMPEMNGIQLANQLKSNELTAHIPILFLTAKGSVENKLEGLASGAEDYIQKPFNTTEVKLKIRNLLESRNSLIKKYQLEETKAVVDSQSDHYLSKVNSIISDHLSDSKLSIEMLCEELGVGRSQLYRKILALTGKSIIEYVNSYRLSKAMELIHQGNLSIKEVAFRVGYNDNHYFSRSFKKEFGKSPTSFLPKR
ncbi:hybrid sensor histidine kinase/response regulator transcription factor [Reichenbachiella versicolor]|uniref:hybrid sensor histidine kinase/response regulator transcription factor n=1 Tax=Reichenbachiella versicolor TaxID=1821036 RepID=UPI000D6E3073|nr:two-component regulator propeller domain-containing protein [Reichenbachiella versicolor]